MYPLPDALAQWLEDGGLASAGGVLRGAFLAAMGVAAAALAAGSRAAGGRRKRSARDGVPVLFPLVALGFAAVFLYQATWQLAGFARPPFAEFMRRYNRRPDAAGGPVARGRILDARGVELAINDPDEPRRRRYPLGRDFCHVVGYADPIYGLCGVEAAEHARLAGYTADSPAERDRFRRNIFDHARARGPDVQLTLDARLQSAATELLAGRTGALVALRPSDGAVLALVSAPPFDPNELEDALAGAEGRSALFPRALQGLYPPGSTFKPALCALAIESGFRGVLPCPAGGYTPGGGVPPIRDHEYHEARREGRTWAGHGMLDLEDALRLSSNVFFARLAAGMGAPRVNVLAERLLYNRPIELLRGPSGRIETKASRLPPIGEGDKAALAQTGIGQGPVVVTPLHAALVVSAIAHRGLAMSPRLSSADPPRPLGRFFTPEAAVETARLMRVAVERGTGRGAARAGVSVAGKTGTAQNPQGEDHAWFVCFAPYEKPALAVAVVVEHGGSGAGAAVPLAVEFLGRARAAGWLADGGFAGETPP